MGDSNPQDHATIRKMYVLPRNEVEQERLDFQHSYLLDVLGGRLIAEESVRVQLKAGSRVLDSGTGAGSWIRAVAKQVPDTVELVGVDISSSMFPAEYPSNVQLIVGSITSLPAEWTGTFDFVNQRLLMAAFTTTLWQSAISEMFRVLKPGGSIQLMEFGHIYCLDGPIETIAPAAKKASLIASLAMESGNLIGVECGNRLPGLLQEAGFSSISVENLKAPMGKHWGEIGVKGNKEFDTVLHAFGDGVLAKGGLGLCESREELETLIENAKREWDEKPGLYWQFDVITAKKSL